MIRIHRPLEAPSILQMQGAPDVVRLMAAFHADPDGYRRGARRMVFQRTIYRDAAVKRSLLAAQHGKCAYCENRIDSEYGGVEHYRPKGAMRQSQVGAAELPGYFWLAYRWDNLLVVCARCNTHKGDLFPLAQPRARAEVGNSHADEAPLLLDPAVDEPERHIRFDGERALAVDVGRRGQVTVEVLGLNRGELLHARREWYDMLSGFLDLLETARVDASIPAFLLVKASGLIAEATRDAGRYAAMVRGLVRSRVGATLAVPCSADELLRWATERER